MCLTNCIRRFAESDITVYKLMKYNEDGTLTTPFFPKVFEIGKRYKNRFSFSWLKRNPEYVSKGFFHSITDLESAVRTCSIINNSNGFNCIVVKCTIPKNTLYYDGYWDTWAFNKSIFVPSICSTTIIPEEIVHHGEEDVRDAFLKKILKELKEL